MQAAGLSKALLDCTRTKTGVPLDHYPSILPTHSSVHNSFTSPYIHTSLHQYLRSTISYGHPCHLVSHPYLSVHFQLHPSTAAHTSVHTPLLYKFIYRCLHPSDYCLIPAHMLTWAQSSLSPSLSEIIGLSLCSFNKRTFTGLSGFLCLSNTYLSTTLPFSHFLLCILDETRKLRLHLSVNEPAIMDLITQSISPSGPSFFCSFLVLCQKPVITDSAARHGCERQSAFPRSLIHLTHTHTQCVVDSCRNSENTWSSNMCKAATSVYVLKVICVDVHSNYYIVIITK